MDTGKHKKLLMRLARLVVVVVVLIVMFRLFEYSQVYHPTRDFEPVDAQSRGLFEDVHFNTSDGVKLNGWFFPAGTNSPRAHMAFLICHGNGGNISHRFDLCKTLLTETGANVFVFDYRGFGRSDGRPSEKGTYLDAQAAFDWLRKRGVQNIIAYGESLGGGVASELALRETVAGLVLQSAFTSIPDIGSELFPWLPVRLLGTIKYDTRSNLPRVKVPVLVMHSRADDIVPFRHGERNFASANEPKTFCELRGYHNDAVWEEPEFKAAIVKFMGLLATSERE